MSRHSPFVITLSAADRRELERRVRSHRRAQRDVLRARIVLLASAGLQNERIAKQLGIVPNTVLKWRKRFFEEGLDGLADRPRSGRPKVFPPSGGRRGEGRRL